MHADYCVCMCCIGGGLDHEYTPYRQWGLVWGSLPTHPGACSLLYVKYVCVTIEWCVGLHKQAGAAVAGARVYCTHCGQGGTARPAAAYTGAERGLYNTPSLLVTLDTD